MLECWFCGEKCIQQSNNKYQISFHCQNEYCWYKCSIHYQSYKISNFCIDSGEFYLSLYQAYNMQRYNKCIVNTRISKIDVFKEYKIIQLEILDKENILELLREIKYYLSGYNLLE